MSSSHSSSLENRLRQNLFEVFERVAAAAHRVGRSAEEVQLVAVTKYTPVEIVQSLIKIGHHVLGENRPQQLIERASELPAEVCWHLIGQLQRNKVRAILPYVSLIHSVDSVKLLHHIDRIAGELELNQKILLQVNTSGEESKSGFTIEEIQHHWEEIAETANVESVGLMTMAPDIDDESAVRSTFRKLRELKEDLNVRQGNPLLEHLSMGMSGDFEIAIEEGATMIRLGSILFAGCDAES